MSWWKTALYDTCSLITLDKMILVRKTIEKQFPKKILALEASFSVDQMRQVTAERMSERVTIQELPSPSDLTAIFTSVQLSSALAEVDKLIYATAVQFELSVVTGDRRLGRAVRDSGQQVADMASVLRELVEDDKLTQTGCVKLLKGLADRNDFLLGTDEPTWELLEAHSFPDR